MRKRLNIRRPFTLIEILTVVTITIMLMMLAMPAFEKMTIGTGVDAAARAVGAQIRLARQYAITNREYVAVLLPGAAGSATELEDKEYSAFRCCVVDSNRVFQDWIPNTKWEFIPAGAIVAEVDSDKETINTGYTPADGTYTTVTAIDEDGDSITDYSGVRAIVFAPSGKISGVGVVGMFVTIIEGAVPSPNSAPIIRNIENHNFLHVDYYTGRVSYE